jgi:hypothetical protein
VRNKKARKIRYHCKKEDENLQLLKDGAGAKAEADATITVKVASDSFMTFDL